jgi:inhibitor of cysteine peptidase
VLINKPQEKWYFRTYWLVIALFCIGPFALPLLWFNPRFSLKKNNHKCNYNCFELLSRDFICQWIMRLVIFAAPVFLLAGALEGSSKPANIIEVTVGKEVVITLGANKTTGFEWQLANPVDKNILEFLGSQYLSNSDRLVGAGGKEVWTFRAIRAGKTTISFKYVRPWEKDVPPAKEETFIVIVK